MDNVKLKKELFDLIIEHAATEYLYDEADALKIKTEKSCDVKFSDGFERKIDVYIQLEKIRHVRKRWAKHLKVIAVAVVIFSLITILSINNVEAFKINFYNIFYSEKPNFVEVKAIKEDSDLIIEKLPDGWDHIYLPDYIPLNYRFESSSNNSSTFKIIFQDKTDKKLVFKQKNYVRDKTVADNETSNFTSITIGHTKGYAVEKNGEIFMSWQNHNYSFELVGSIDIKELRKMAESLKIHN
ncbi:DUF4367 domain-containing protein [Paenibacillus sp. FSL R7-0297]|uniref:DUF4367 domain-containing protein n=1 Tax=Paenibacillus sp. FSL R7-0297 TaxID=2921680 RepID=UPI0030FAB413